MTYDQQCQEDARLAILAELAQQRDARLNSRNLQTVVDQIVRNRSREWVELQLRWLGSMGAINLVESNLPGLGPVHLATLTRLGRDHVERRQFIPGVTLPADEE